MVIDNQLSLWKTQIIQIAESEINYKHWIVNRSMKTLYIYSFYLSDLPRFKPKTKTYFIIITYFNPSNILINVLLLISNKNYCRKLIKTKCLSLFTSGVTPVDILLFCFFCWYLHWVWPKPVRDCVVHTKLNLYLFEEIWDEKITAKIQ